MFGWIIVIGCIIWQYKQPWRALPSAILAAYFGLSALAMLMTGHFDIWLLLYGVFAFLSGRRTLQMRRNGAGW